MRTAALKLGDWMLTRFVCADVDILSTSAIHQGVPIVDFSLKINVDENCQS